MHANLFIGAQGIPAGFELVQDEAVKHPRDGMIGALVRNTATGVYCLLNAGVLRSYPMRGGKREGAGRKPANEARRPVNIRLTETEVAALKAAAEDAGKSLSQHMRDIVIASLA